MCKPTDRDTFIKRRGPSVGPSGHGAGGGDGKAPPHAIHSLIGSIATAYSGIHQSQSHTHSHPPFAVPLANTGVIALQRSGGGDTHAAVSSPHHNLGPQTRKRHSPNHVTDNIHDTPSGKAPVATEPSNVPSSSASRPRKRAKTDGGNSEKEHPGKPSGGRRTSRRRRSSLDNSDGGKANPHHPHDQGVVQHSYHDHALELPDYQDNIAELKQKRGGGTNTPFPVVLHRILDAAADGGYTDIISWQPHGRAFMVHNQDRFVSELMPQFFRQTRFSSFQRQLSLYGFLRLTRKGPDYSGYYHEFFLRGKPFLSRKIVRTRIKGYWVRQSSSPETEPDFTNMPPVGGGLSPAAVQAPPAIQAPPPAIQAPSAAPRRARTIMTAAAPKSAVVVSSTIAPLHREHETSSSSYSVVKVPVTAVTSTSKLPPMPPLDAYRRGIGWPMTVPPIPQGDTSTGGAGAVTTGEEQETLAAFLSDVDLDSEDENDKDGGAYKGEDHMAEIYQNEKVSHHHTHA